MYNSLYKYKYKDFLTIGKRRKTEIMGGDGIGGNEGVNCKHRTQNRSFRLLLYIHKLVAVLYIYKSYVHKRKLILLMS